MNVAEASESGMFGGADDPGSSFEGRDFSDDPDALIDIAIRQRSVMQKNPHQFAMPPDQPPQKPASNDQIPGRTSSARRDLLQVVQDFEIFQQARTAFMCTSS